jgi:hypothetical protein
MMKLQFTFEFRSKIPQMHSSSEPTMALELVMSELSKDWKMFHDYVQWATILHKLHYYNYR